MRNLYRVEAHDGNTYSFGIKIDPNKRIPIFCNLDVADLLPRSAAQQLMATAIQHCGGTLRLQKVKL